MTDALLTVEDLVRSPALQLEVVAGASGLDRQVRWAHVSELADPTPWLLGGELLMSTGIAVPRAGTDQSGYLARLADAGVAGLALSDQLHVPPLRPTMLAEADRRAFPVLRVPLPVPFIAIAQEVAAAVQSDMQRRLTAQLHVFGALRTVAAEDLSAAQLFARLEALSGYSLQLCTPTGRPLLRDVPTPGPDVVDHLPPTFDAPPSFADGTALPVPAPGGPVGWLVARERDGVQAAGLAVAQHIATIAALQVASQRHERETARRQGAEVLAELLTGSLEPAAVRRRLSRAGLPLHDPLQVVVLRAPDGAGWDDAELTRRLDLLPRRVLALRQRSDVVVLTAADVPVDALTAGGASVGVSRPFTASDPVTVARREAVWAAARASDAGGGVVRYGDDRAGRWLAEDRAALTALVDEVLSPVTEYDRAHGTAVLATVRSWLERDRATREVAAALHIHPNTLAYRLRRFEELTGRSLTATSDVAEVWLALHAAGQV